MSARTFALGLEEWRAIPGWEGYYEASSHGRIRSMPRVVATRTRSSQHYPGKILSATTSQTGHKFLRLFRGGQGTQVMVHRLVLAAFIGPRPDGLEACHNDGNPANNHVENLRWDTHSANMLDRTRHGNCHNSQKTHCPANHPYDDANTHVNRKGQRVCRICQREAGRRHDQKRRGRKRVAA